MSECILNEYLKTGEVEEGDSLLDVGQLSVSRASTGKLKLHLSYPNKCFWCEKSEEMKFFIGTRSYCSKKCAEESHKDFRSLLNAEVKDE